MSKKRNQWVKTFFRSPIMWALLAALAVTVPQIPYSYFVGDDNVHLGILEGVLDHPGMGPLSLFQFIDGDPGHLPAYIDNGPMSWFVNPHIKIKFFRPLSSALIVLNHKLFGLNPLAFSIHGLLWYLLLMVCLVLLLRQVFPAPARGKSHGAVYVASIVFAVSASHFSTFLYSPARWLLVTAVFGIAATTAHIKWREQDWRPGRILSIIAFLVALLCGEAALAVIAYLVAYELLVPRESLKKRITAVLPFVIIVFIYLLVYSALGYGTTGQGFYLNPLTEPITFIKDLPTRFSAILAELFLGVNASAWLDPLQRLTVVLWGVIALVGCGLLLYPAWTAASLHQRRRINWIITGTVGAILPFTAREPNAHIMVIPFIGGSILVAMILYYWWQRLFKKRDDSPNPFTVIQMPFFRSFISNVCRKKDINKKEQSPYLAKASAREAVKTSVIKQRLVVGVNFCGAAACLLLIYIHLLLAPYSWFVYSKGWNKSIERIEAFNRQRVLNELKPHQKAIFLNPVGNFYLFKTYYHRKLNRLPMPESWWLLSMSSNNHRYHRTDKNILELEMIGGSMLDSLMESATRGKGTPLKKGEVIRLEGLKVTVLETTHHGPIRVEFIFDRQLEDDCYRFFRCQQGRLIRVNPPPVGQSILLVR